VVFALVFGLMSLTYAALGAERAFQPGGWEISGIWIATAIVVGLVAAVVGGYVCAMIAKDARGPLALIGLVVVLGLVFAIPVLTGDPGTAGPRPEGASMADAMANAVQPAWIALLNPLLGAVGVWLGARLRKPTPA